MQTNLTKNWHFCSLPAHLALCWWAVSRKTPIYFIVIVDIIVFYCLVFKILCSLQTGKVRLGEAAYPRFMGWASGNASL